MSDPVGERAAHAEAARSVIFPSPQDLLLAGFPEDAVWEAAFEIERGPEFFFQRAMALSPARRERVLDAACGIGTWSIALTSTARFVAALDRNQVSLRIGRYLQKANRVEGLVFLGGDLHRLPFRDETFDLVVCAGALMYVRAAEALEELVRVLQPGGAIYLCVNGVGWYLFELPRLAFRHRRLAYVKGSLLYLLRTTGKWVLGGDPSHTAFTRREMVRLLERAGVRPLLVSDEGHGVVPGARVTPVPAYRGRYLGLNGIFEVIGVKC